MSMSDRGAPLGQAQTRVGKPLAVTMGDPAGIGPDITLMAWRQRAQRAIPPFAVYADPMVLEARAKSLGIDAPLLRIADIDEAVEVFPIALPVISVAAVEVVVMGAPSTANNLAVVSAIERAVDATIAGHACAVVTNPIAKSVLYGSGFKYPGHTEFLGELARRLVPGRASYPVMMLASEELRVVPLTVHIPLSEVPGAITRPAIIQTARLTWDALCRDFGIANPVIAVAGLNPHAGEGGSIGREDCDIIAPAVQALRAEGMAISGPFSADTLFHAAARQTYDAVICMYHDQALIPLKTLAFDTGVNITIGLPFVRTSPDHGTAFDIAGTGRARPESLIQSMRLAAEIGARRGPADVLRPASGSAR